MTDVEDLHRFILANAEEIDGQLVCRTPIAPWLRERNAPGNRKVLRASLVRELEQRGLVHPPSPAVGLVDRQ
jgi:hypothetical protein